LKLINLITEQLKPRDQFDDDQFVVAIATHWRWLLPG